MQLILTVFGFCICEFTYLLSLIFNPQIKACDIFVAIRGHVQSGELRRRKGRNEMVQLKLEILKHLKIMKL